jgi:hypothetical protein
MDDLFSVRYQKMLRVMKRHPQVQMNPLGNIAHFVPLLLRSLANVGFVQRRLLRGEQKLVEKRERDCLAWFDKTLLINEAEADLPRKETGPPSIRTVSSDSRMPDTGRIAVTAESLCSSFWER